MWGPAFSLQQLQRRCCESQLLSACWLWRPRLCLPLRAGDRGTISGSDKLAKQHYNMRRCITNEKLLQQSRSKGTQPESQNIEIQIFRNDVLLLTLTTMKYLSMMFKLQTSPACLELFTVQSSKLRRQNKIDLKISASQGKCQKSQFTAVQHLQFQIKHNFLSENQVSGLKRNDKNHKNLSESKKKVHVTGILDNNFF